MVFILHKILLTLFVTLVESTHSNFKASKAVKVTHITNRDNALSNKLALLTFTPLVTIVQYLTVLGVHGTSVKRSEGFIFQFHGG